MDVKDLLSNEIQSVYTKDEKEFLVFLQQTDEGDDSCYLVNSETGDVTYKSYIGLLGTEDFNESDYDEFPIDEFISMMNQNSEERAS